MTDKLELYKCDICGNLIEIVIAGYGELVCCGQPMKKLYAGTNDEADTEKHVPVFEHIDDGGLKIRIGALPHPMIPEHFIMFIESISQDKNCIQRHCLHPDEAPEMIIKKYQDKILAREYCNIHGLWEAVSD